MISKEVIVEHKKEIEYKSLACETNINNIKYLLQKLENEISTNTNENSLKTLTIQKDNYTEELKTNEEAKIMHDNNIIYLNKLLWVK